MLARAVHAVAEVEARDARLEILDQRAQLLHRRGNRLVARRRLVRDARDHLDVLADVHACVCACSSLDCVTCLMLSSTLPEFSMIESSASPALSTS